MTAAPKSDSLIVKIRLPKTIIQELCRKHQKHNETAGNVVKRILLKSLEKTE
ncbi:MAG: hypothetical protein PHE55_00855 [Methylococcaceae bacterium]|nr:hypothetical protein [Methylococcaceae bacterium]